MPLNEWEDESKSNEKSHKDVTCGFAVHGLRTASCGVITLQTVSWCHKHVSTPGERFSCTRKGVSAHLGGVAMIWILICMVTEDVRGAVSPRAGGEEMAKEMVPRATPV